MVFDRKTATLYYYPMPGEAILGTEIIVPWHEQIVRLEGGPERMNLSSTQFKRNHLCQQRMGPCCAASRGWPE